MKQHLSALLGGLILNVAAQAAAPDGERIVDTRTGQSLSQPELLARLRQADFLLLGEIHDSPVHHRIRAELITTLGARTVAAEHMDRGRRFSAGPAERIRTDLEAAGFDAAAWQWPVHEPLFGGLARAGIDVIGANLPREQARNVVRSGSSALPADIAATLALGPLSDTATQALDTDLLESHCGQLPASRVPAMRLAQRARDGAMATELTHLTERPAILVAGNGHVRGDYGVPQLLAHLKPDARIVSIAFEETGDGPDTSLSPHTYSYVWYTAPTPRTDPCAGFSGKR